MQMVEKLDRQIARTKSALVHEMRQVESANNVDDHEKEKKVMLAKIEELNAPPLPLWAASSLPRPPPRLSDDSGSSDQRATPFRCRFVRSLPPTSSLCGHLTMGLSRWRPSNSVRALCCAPSGY